MSFAYYSGLASGDLGVAQTVSTIQSLIYQALNHDPDARIRKRAESLLINVGEKDDLGEIEAIYDYVLKTLHYVSDPVDVELVKSPLLVDQDISAQGFFMGDCDDAAAYLAALLKSVGFFVQLVTVAPNGAPGYDYRHIFVRVWVEKDNEWMALDPTAKIHPMGWEVPNKKERVYNV